MSMNNANEGIELLYTPDCPNWPATLANLKQALLELAIAEEPAVIKLETIEQAKIYNFFASPTIHLNGLDLDRAGRRISKRALGRGRPYWYKKQVYLVPPVEFIKQGLIELYT